MKSKLIILLLFILALPITLAQPTDPRVCGEAKRDSLNRILRDRQALRDFQKLYPCPSTGKTYGACPGFAIDHVIPMACGGCDSIVNLQWLPVKIKSCDKDYCKDRFERKVYKNHLNLPYCK